MLHTRLHLNTILYQKDKRAKPGNLPKSSFLSEIGQYWTEKYFHVVFVSSFYRVKGMGWGVLEDLCSSEYGAAAGSYEHGYETSDSVKCRIF
jgi:hypothetical protein